MDLKNIQNQKEWDDFLVTRSQSSFTQSFEWGEILKKEGKEVERLFFFDREKIIGAAQLIKNKALGFEYYFCPKGPVASGQYEEVIKKINEYGAKNNCSFVRIEPTANDFINQSSAKQKKTIDINPRATTIIDLLQSEEELLKRMHAKTRYNIRLSEKKNLSISNEKNFEIFWQLMNETGKRDGFKLHDKNHYEKIFASNLVEQYTAVVESKNIATIVLVKFGDTTTYLYGASDYEHRSLMAPYLLQWQAIKNARKNGSHYYDMFGIAPHKKNFSGTEYEYDEKHQYAGVTRFKLGFGGEVVELPGTFDLVVDEKKYKLYEVLRALRRLV